MNKPQRQHYVPRMLLRRFTDDEGMFYVFMQDQPFKGIFRTSPSKVFRKTHLYSKSTFDGNKDYETEHFFSGLENRVSPILDHIIRSSRSMSNPDLEDEEKELFYRFYYAQIKRTPDMLESMPDTVDPDIIAETIARHESETGESVTPEEYADLHSPEMVQNAKADSLRMVGNALDKINDSELRISVSSSPNLEFVIGSNPIVVPSLYGASQFSIPKVEWWLPLAPDVAIKPSLPGFGVQPLLPYGVNERLTAHDADFVRELNDWGFRQSKTVAGRSRESIESLIERAAAKSGCKSD